MTPTASLLAFTAAAALLTATPGLDTALVLRTAIGESRRAAWATAAGICLGCLVWALLVAAGVVALLEASALAYAVLKMAGACWLVWMGVQLLWKRRPGSAASLPVAAAPAVEAHAGSVGAAFMRGLVTNLLNPKVGVFYVTFLPPFVPAGVEPGPWMVGLGAIHAGLGIVWLGALAQVGLKARRTLSRPAVGAWIDRACGIAFVGFGIRLALASPRATP